MFVEESDHLESLRAIPSSRHGQQPRLPLKTLLKRLRDRTGFDHAGTSRNGKKSTSKSTTKSKKRSHDENSEDGQRKRVKVSSEDAVDVVDTERLLPIYQRVLRISYTTSAKGPRNQHYSDEEMAERGWVDDEQILRDWLIGASSSPRSGAERWVALGERVVSAEAGGEARALASQEDCLVARSGG